MLASGADQPMACFHPALLSDSTRAVTPGRAFNCIASCLKRLSLVPAMRATVSGSVMSHRPPMMSVLWRPNMARKSLSGS